MMRLGMSAVALVALTAGGMAVAGPASAAPATITSITPSSGPLTGGTKIVVIGTGFSAASTTVVLGRVSDRTSAACTDVVVVSSTRVTCTTGEWPGTPGLVDALVTGADGKGVLANAFTYSDSSPLPLTVNAASASTALPRAGSTVVITSATTSAQGRVHLKAVCTAGTRVLGDQRLCSTSTGANGKLTVRTYGVRGGKVTVTAVAIPLAGQTGVTRSRGWVRTWAVS